jgi:hypothetical protein
MFWEYYADRTGELLDTLFQALRTPAPGVVPSPKARR